MNAEQLFLCSTDPCRHCNYHEHYSNSVADIVAGRVASYRSLTASACIKTLVILAQPAVNHVGIQPVAQRYRGNGCISVTAGLKHLSPELGPVLAPRHSLCFHSVHLFASWTLCLPALPPVVSAD